jgi:chromosomal replication initiator protein
LGEDKFIEKIESKKNNFEPVLYDMPINDIVSVVCKVFEIESEKLYSLTRNRAGAHGRNLVAYLARKLSGYLVKDIAKYFQREPMVISQGIIKVERLIQSNIEQKKMLETAEDKLVRGRKKKYFITIA